MSFRNVLRMIAFSAVLLALPSRLHAQLQQQSPATIDSIDAASGVVHGHVNATGQTLEVKITNPAVLKQLRSGQRFFVDLGASLDGRRTAGTMVSLGPAATKSSNSAPAAGGGSAA